MRNPSHFPKKINPGYYYDSLGLMISAPMGAAHSVVLSLAAMVFTVEFGEFQHDLLPLSQLHWYSGPAPLRKTLFKYLDNVTYIFVHYGFFLSNYTGLDVRVNSATRLF